MNQPHRIIVARHGNTFQPDEKPRRVGARTDIPLVASGRDQAIRLGAYLRNYNIFPDRIVAAGLMRTRETAKLATDILNPEIDERFNEIDYGPDENCEEADVIARVGAEALTNWNDNAIPPAGWNVDTGWLIQVWKDFADDALSRPAATILVVTSNGIARFAPYITDDFDGFARQYPLKLATGAFGSFEYHNNQWVPSNWNIRP